MIQHRAGPSKSRKRRGPFASRVGSFECLVRTDKTSGTPYRLYPQIHLFAMSTAVPPACYPLTVGPWLFPTRLAQTSCQFPRREEEEPFAVRGGSFSLVLEASVRRGSGEEGSVEAYEATAVLLWLEHHRCLQLDPLCNPSGKPWVLFALPMLHSPNSAGMAFQSYFVAWTLVVLVN